MQAHYGNTKRYDSAPQKVVTVRRIFCGTPTDRETVLPTDFGKNAFSPLESVHLLGVLIVFAPLSYNLVYYITKKLKFQEKSKKSFYLFFLLRRWLFFCFSPMRAPRMEKKGISARSNKERMRENSCPFFSSRKKDTNKKTRSSKAPQSAPQGRGAHLW